MFMSNPSSRRRTLRLNTLGTAVCKCGVAQQQGKGGHPGERGDDLAKTEGCSAASLVMQISQMA
jgi:hypothetical protein